jgi:outer membrane protein TolC
MKNILSKEEIAMKKWMTSVVASSLVLTLAPSALADSAVTVTIDGKQKTFEQPPVIVHDRTLVPMRTIFEALGATVSWNPTTRTVSATKGDTTIVLLVNSDLAWKNNAEVKLDTNSEIVNGRTMVPVRFVSEALGASVQWDANTRTVSITTNPSASVASMDVISTASSSVSPSSDTNEATNNADAPSSLTYQKALDMALAYSYALKNAQADIDRSKEVLKQASDNVKYNPGDGSQNAYANRAYTGYAQANVNYEMASKTYEVEKDTITYMVKQAYNAVLQAQEKKKLADLTMENALLQNQIAQYNYNNGVISKTDWEQKNNDYQSAQANQEAAAKALDDAYQKLNQLLGLPGDARPQLVDQPQMNVLADTDVEGKVTQVQTSSPSVWLAEQKVDLAKLQLDLYTFNDKSQDPYKAKEIDVTKATNSASDVKDQLAKSVRSLYNSIRQLEDQYQALQSKLASAEQTLNKTQALYNNGMATKADLVAAQLNVESLKQQLFDTIAQHDNAVLAYDKPWVLGG